jgi:Ca2+-binding RTX toxin-like protein
MNMTMEILESRQLMSVGTPLDGTLPDNSGSILEVPKVTLSKQGVLKITGTSTADKISVSQDINNIKVAINGLKHAFAIADVKRITATLGRGNDVFEANDLVTIPMVVKGNVGNDKLVGGFSDDRLEGGAGNDVLDGNRGSDKLIGGRGKDLIESAEQTVVFVRAPDRDSPLFHDKDEVFAEDGSRDVIRHDSADVLHTDALDVKRDVFAR